MEQDYDRWLARPVKATTHVHRSTFSVPQPSELMEAHEANKAVGDVKNNTPDLLNNVQ
jgi:putative SOS response-associated peptidase YedK